MLRRQAFQVDLAKRYYYDLPEEQHDVHIKLIDLEKVKYGQPYKVRIVLEVSCANDMNDNSNSCKKNFSHSIFTV